MAIAPNDLTAWGLLSALASERKDKEGLLEATDALIASSPPDYAFLHDRAIALSDLGRHGSAIESVSRALALAPENPGLLLLEVQTYLVAGKNRETVDAFRRIRGRDDCKGRAELWFWGARAELNVNEYAAAKISATQAIELLLRESMQRDGQDSVANLTVQARARCAYEYPHRLATGPRADHVLRSPPGIAVEAPFILRELRNFLQLLLGAFLRHLVGGHGCSSPFPFPSPALRSATHPHIARASVEASQVAPSS